MNARRLPAPVATGATRLGQPWTGLCVSGGGARAAAAAQGELRGLAALGLLPQIGWLSTVLGRTRAGTLPGGAPTAWPDAPHLGPLELDPGKLRWESGSAADDLSRLDPHALGSAAIGLGIAGLPGNAARPCPVGDDGGLENQGILPLLRRGLRKIVAFVNTETQLAMSRSQVIVDSGLAALFGREWQEAAGEYGKTSSTSPLRLIEAFDRDTFDDLRHQLWNRALAGATAMALQKGVTVLPNPHYGVASGTTDILWIYLHPVNAWYRRLHDTVRLAMELEPCDYATFPNYATVAQPHLNAHQINLLAHLTSWNVAAEVEVGGFPGNATVVKTFIGS